ncbi:cytochrome P450 [Chitinophaga solisilvae]|uniref:cytochrome P450 n=1 Tax=Chitinophaga solisilvae TaxID=1233460 RepID=UPI00136E0D19|nr:cytochrome P450 [Chitinophaga solisilvae]
MPVISQPFFHPVDIRPVHFDQDHRLMFGGKGAWQVYRHADVQRIFMDYETFSNAFLPRRDDYIIGSNFNQLDPPLHGLFRALIAPPFSRSAVAKQEEHIRALCISLLEENIQHHEMEFVRDFALPLSAGVIGSILGIPSSALPKVNYWAKTIVNAGYVEGGPETAAKAQEEMTAFFTHMMALRKQQPEDDLITKLSLAKIGDEEVLLSVKIATCMTILIGGYETTASLLTNAVQIFIEYPELQEILMYNPELIPRAIWEVLRLRPSPVSMYRRARHDVYLDGQLIRKDDLLNGWIAAANRDPEVFPDPHNFDLYRNHLRGNVLSFGYGLHYCVGDTLARTEVRIALEEILRRMRHIHLQPGVLLQPSESGIAVGFQQLPIAFNTWHAIEKGRTC